MWSVLNSVEFIMWIAHCTTLHSDVYREPLFPECDEIASSSLINLFAKRRLIAVFVILGVYP